MNVRRHVGAAVALVVCLSALAVLGLSQSSLSADGPRAGAAVSTGESTATETSKASLEGLSYKRVSNPTGTKVVDAKGKEVARFTDTARTAVLQGKERTLEEPGKTDARVTSTSYVRVMPQPYTQGAEKKAWFKEWLAKSIKDKSPDVLEVGTQYFHGAENVYDENGLRIAGDADFGPEKGAGGEKKGSDFNDFLEIKVAFPDEEDDRPEKSQKNALDPPGFVRMVYGYRLGYPMYGKNPKGEALQRGVAGLHDNGPGVLLARDTGTTPPLETLEKQLLPGDILMFATDMQPNLNHSAIYMGRDDRGNHRFMSSREAVNGPTMGDFAAPSIIDGHDLFAANFRAVRRI